MCCLLLIFLGDTNGTPEDTLKFELKIKCTWNPSRTKEMTKPEDLYRDFKGKKDIYKWSVCTMIIVVLEI